MKTPTDATKVFAPTTYTGNGSTGQTITTNFSVDFSLFINRTKTNSINNVVFDRLRGLTQLLPTNTSDAETALSTTLCPLFDSNTGIRLQGATAINGSGASFIVENFKRAPGFFDVVCYTGTGSNQSQSHNLGVAPELLITKWRGGAQFWFVDRPNNTTAYNQALLNDTSAFYDNWLPSGLSATTTTFNASQYASGRTYVAYLFATCPGVSKVFSYTGNGSSQAINCGFAAGARFVLIKRTDSTGDWYVWDTARGIVSANDPHLSLNTTAAEVTTDDTIDPDSSGFIVNQVSATNVNVSSATYIGLAIA